jgi:hypothetical protein
MIFEKVFKEIQDSIKRMEVKVESMEQTFGILNSNLSLLFREMNKTATKKKVE